MVTVRMTNALKKFFPDLKTIEVEASNVRELIDVVEGVFPGIRNYLIDEHGACRKHVNIFIGEEMIIDKVGLSDVLKVGDEVFIYQALSGG
jgi:molybdopterin converting factor small subunit